MREVKTSEDVSLLSEKGTDLSLLMAMPTEVSGNLATTFGNLPKIIKQSFFALFICAAACIFAGLSIAKMAEMLVTYPGLIILIPSVINMRGNIFGSFGARLGTSFHTGEISPPLSESPALRQQVKGTVVQTLVMSLVLALVVKGFGLAAGLETMSIYDLILISTLCGVLSGGILLVFSLLLISQSFRKGWDPDNISVPLITAAGDVITIPLLFASAILVTWLGDPVVKAIGYLLIMLSTAATVYSLGAGYPLLARIVRESFPILIASSLLSTVAGILMGMNVDMLVTFSAVLLLIPAFNAEGGNLGGVLSSQLTSAYHLGLTRLGRRPDRRTRNNLIGIFILSLLIFPTLGLLAYLISRIFDLASPGFGELLFICLVAGLFTTVLAIITTYYFTYFFIRIGVDPDNVTIPMITSVMDVLGTASLILVTLAVVT